MSAPVTEMDHDYPPDGSYVTIEGVISTEYLHRDQRMIIRWTTFWEAMADYGYIRPVNIEDNPDADRLFPTLAEVSALIAQGATTLPGEKILGVRAVDDTLFWRVGADMEHSRELPVVVPRWEEIGVYVDRAETAATDAEAARLAAQTIVANGQYNVQQAADAAAQSVLSQTAANASTAVAAKNSAEAAATRSENAATRAENAANQADVQLASPTQVGIVKLAGDLAGTANVPTVPALANKYEKPGSGIPNSDLTAAARTSLGKADTAYQKPGSGIPASDLAAAVQSGVNAGASAYQKPGAGIPKADLVAAVQASLGLADVAVSAPGNATGWKLWFGTEAQYQALPSKDSLTVYLRSA